MNFDLTAGQQEWARRAGDVSRAVVAAQADAVDDGGVIPDAVRNALAAPSFGNPFSEGAVAGSLVLEEIAAVSAGVATAVGLEWTGHAHHGAGPGFPGLRGSGLETEQAARERPAVVRLVLCAVAIGVARAAVQQAVDVMKSRGIRPSGDESTPHWALADAAAEVDAARLLTLAAAQVVERSEPVDVSLAMAAGLSGAAVERAVEAAGLVAGSAGYLRGSVLERLTRDARTLRLLLHEGTRPKAQGTTAE